MASPSRPKLETKHMENSLLIVHLSDFHFEASTEQKLLDSRAKAICNAALTGRVCSGVVFILSGDIAYAGHPDEYAVAERFVFGLLESAGSFSKTCPNVHFVMAPGNHDLDFRADSAVTSTLRGTNDKEKIASDVQAQELMRSLQSNYAAFESQMDTLAVETKSVFSKVSTLTFGENRLSIRVLNSSLFSSKREIKGGLFLPENAYLSDWSPRDINICVLHHPYGWFSESTGRKLRTALRTNANIVLFGHEHVPDATVVTAAVNHQTDVSTIEIDGGVLFDKDDYAQSSFTVIQIDVVASDDPASASLTTFEFDTRTGAYQNKSSSTRAMRTSFDLPAKGNGSLFNETFVKRLHSPGFDIRSVTGRAVLARELYVHRELEQVISSKKTTLLVAADSVLRTNTSASEFLIEGDERSGKTTLLLRFVEQTHQDGFTPIYVDLMDSKPLSAEVLKACIAKALAAVYANVSIDDFLATPFEKRLLILDNADSVVFSSKGNSFINLARSWAKTLVVATSISADLAEASSGDSFAEIGQFERYKFTPFNNTNSHDLITNWLKVVEEVDSSEEFLRRLDLMETAAADTLGKNLLPRNPHMLLLFLQAGHYVTDRQNQSILAYYYEKLIQQQLQRVVKSDELGEVLNFAKYLAGGMFKSNREYLLTADAESINAEFSQRFYPRETTKRLNTLVNAGILLSKVGDDAYIWKHSYAYNLFLGQYLNEHIDDATVFAAVSDLSNHSYLTKNANILLFLLHYCKSPKLFDELIAGLSQLFNNARPFSMGTDTLAFVDHIKDARDLLLPDSNKPTQNRRAAHQRKDQIERQQTQMPQLRRNDGPLTRFEQYTALLKVSEIYGQVFREHYASVDRKVREDLLKALLNAHRRAITSLLDLLTGDEAKLKQWLQSKLRADGLTTPEQITAALDQIMSSLVQAVMLSSYHKLSKSIASDKTHDLIKSLDAKGSLDMQLLQLGCELSLQRKIPHEKLKFFAKTASDDPAFFALVKHLLRYRLMFFHTDVQDRDSVADLFKINKQSLQISSYKRQSGVRL